jgi:hypothetical protein
MSMQVMLSLAPFNRKRGQQNSDEHAGTEREIWLHPEQVYI